MSASIPFTVGELVRDGVRRMSAAGVSNADWEAQEMMAAALGEAKSLVPLRHRDILSANRRDACLS